MHSFPTAPADRPGVVVLDEDERVLGVAYATLLPILDRLLDCPFDPAAYAAMAAYLTGMGDQAAEAFARVTERGEFELAARAAVITSAVTVRAARRESDERP